MNSQLLAIALLSVALVGATRENDIDWCIKEKGLSVETDKPLLESIGEPDSADKLKDAPKDKYASVIACIFKSDIHKKRALNDVIQSLITADKKLTDDQKKQMTDTLADCNTKANGDDEKLLQCVKITDEPFGKIGNILIEMPEQNIECFVEKELNTEEIFWLRKFSETMSVKDALAHVDEDKVACGFACIAQKEKEKHPEMTDTLKDRINVVVEKAVADGDIQKQMRETVQKCNAEAGNEDDCNFLKCIKLFQPPFVDVVFARPQQQQP